MTYNKDFKARQGVVHDFIHVMSELEEWQN